MPPPSIEQLQDNIDQLQQTVRQLESRLVEDERTNGTRPSQAPPLNISDEAKLQTLWRAQQDTVNFYDFNSDAYYFNGKGHFTD